MLLAPVTPGDAEKVPPSLVGELLAVLRTMFDYVVVDTPPSISEHVLTAMDASAYHVLLTTPDVPALKNLRVVLDMLDMLSYPAEIRSVVLNRAEAKLRLSQEDVERVIRTPVAAQVPNSRAVPISVNNGTPITLASPGHAVSKAINAFAQQRLLPAPVARGRRRGRSGQAAGMSLSERLARQAGTPRTTVRPTHGGGRRPAAPTRSPTSGAACTTR